VALAFQSIDDVHGSDGLSLGVLCVGDGIADDIFKEQSPNPPPAAHKKPAAKNEGPTYQPKLDFVSPQMGTFQKILESNGVYGPPPKQPIHKSQLRAGLQSLCKNNFDRKNYLD
jgi:hypothetical protein